ncbi:MAG: hypothetical protein JRH18_14155 [Deltaproteobacteria bacterium]|nr:hypothetical protein [Deltaproteobacteria bacterium]MBW1993790.1 hypothetical protein [Deltaproteobacteria bacterium]MBW2152798.1 hypothetical protein [Deltaproteobacteria bacterium]
MKPEQIYEHLKDMSEKLGINVSEENFRKSGVRVKSGFCKIKGKPKFIMDKHLKIKEKIDILASFLTTCPHEDLYVVPAVRELIQKTAIRIERQGGVSVHSDREDEFQEHK